MEKVGIDLNLVSIEARAFPASRVTLAIGAAIQVSIVSGIYEKEKGPG